MSSKYGAWTTFWPWLSLKNAENLLSCSLFSRKRAVSRVPEEVPRRRGWRCDGTTSMIHLTNGSHQGQILACCEQPRHSVVCRVPEEGPRRGVPPSLSVSLFLSLSLSVCLTVCPSVSLSFSLSLVNVACDVLAGGGGGARGRDARCGGGGGFDGRTSILKRARERERVRVRVRVRE